MEGIELVFDPPPAEALSRHVLNAVLAHNFARTGVSESHAVNFMLKNARGEILGGLIGHVWGGWLQISLLFVSAAVRGQGQGSRLMDAAEAMAVERGATAATLDTHSFQARGFYEKRGYRVFGQLDDYPPGHSKFFLRKTLAR
ncbi:GNAT family N-acetyltransferase [Rhodopila sp.]|uniref:GNAT family N-acetyltransferase n=1 Tax=Rhodopila sp. TaxID=2480087 RepID=UPI002BBA9A6C|nr:GNAT family N-acetyltransferase [Rhodopila sp.]HVZ09912.1 GNAT family N-acetyltransferase [Rhodopila sp.]